MNRIWLGAACLSLACTACFSTTPPDVQEPTNSAGGGATWVRGKVSRRITTAEYRAAINWSVQVNWYGPDRNGDGAPDRILRTVVKTNGDGAYAMQYRDVRDPVYVEVMAVRCDFDQNSNAYDCCIATDACQSSCPDVWAATHGTTVKKNETARIDLIVNCAVD